MMKGVFVKVPLCPNEDMVEKPANMFTKLQDVKHFHCGIRLIEIVDISSNVGTVAIATEPGGHKARSSQNKVSSNGGDSIVDNSIG